MVTVLTADNPMVIDCLDGGGVIAYPTEGVMGIGCDPFNEDAVEKIRQLKARPKVQGMICVASSWDQCAHWVMPVSEARMAEIEISWPGPVTWVFEASELAPEAVCAEDGTVAIRVSAHPVVQQLCDAFSGALVSTSANARSEAPCLDATAVAQLWGDQLCAIVLGDLQTPGQASTIKEAATGKLFRC